MKRLILKATLIILVLALAIAAITTIAQENFSKEEVAAQVLLQILQNWHYNSVKLNDEFSQRAFTLFIKNLDYSKRFYLKSDFEDLKYYQNKIDDELKRGNLDLYEQATNLLYKRIREVQGVAQDILKKPFDYKVNESIELDPDKRNFPADSTEQKEFWRKLLKYQTLLEYNNLVESDKNLSSKQKQQFQPKYEEEARANIEANIKRSLNRLLHENNIDKIDRYLNAIAGSFDPHTEYLAPQKKEDFDISMSGTLEGIGALLSEQGSYIKVEEVVPGGPAWRQKQLQAGDLILKVAQGDNEPVDIIDMPVDDAVQLIRGKKGTEVRLTVKKPDGQIVTIPIIREVVVVEETYAKTAIIDDAKDDKKIGYIYLPTFYHDFNESDNGRDCADDIKAELETLKSEKVDGIILDLRNNGGGALDDAVKMSGLFIKSGPIVQVKDNEGRKEILNDPGSDVVYGGPLVVLVNSLSASASEILAAALQDYGRAVIIGGSSTFGKGTVQAMVDIDRFLPGDYQNFKPLGSLKLTIQKFYRINGGSTQYKGVAADISLPDAGSNSNVNEKALDYSLPWDTVSSVPYKKWGDTPDLTGLKQKSLKRVQGSKAFKFINDYLTAIKKIQNSPQTLELTKLKQEQEFLKEESEKLDSLQPEKSYLKITLPAENKNDQEDPEKTAEWLKQINRDIYIEEALNVLDDMAR